MKPHTESPAIAASLEGVDVFGHAYRAAVALLFAGIETGVNSLGAAAGRHVGSTPQAVR